MEQRWGDGWHSGDGGNSNNLTVLGRLWARQGGEWSQIARDNKREGGIEANPGGLTLPPSCDWGLPK